MRLVEGLILENEHLAWHGAWGNGRPKSTGFCNTLTGHAFPPAEAQEVTRQYTNARFISAPPGLGLR